MTEHPEMWAVVLIIGSAIITLLGKITFDWLKNKDGDSKIYVCPLDKAAAVDYIKRACENTQENQDILKKMETNLNHGISVAERNTESYHKFLIILNDLKNMIVNNTEAQKEIVKEIKTQTIILRDINKNGK